MAIQKSKLEAFSSKCFIKNDSLKVKVKAMVCSICESIFYNPETIKKLDEARELLKRKARNKLKKIGINYTIKT